MPNANMNQNQANNNLGTNTAAGNTTGTSSQWSERDLVDDILHSEKQMLMSYGTYLAETSCPNLRNEFLKIITDKQQVQFQIYDLMTKKGWYPVKNAKLTDVQNAIQKYSSMKPQLN